MIRSHLPAIDACRDAGPGGETSPEGAVKMKFTVGFDGGVTRAQVVSATPGYEAVADCLRARVETWVLPEPRGGGIAIVTHTFEFGADGYRPAD